MKFYLFIILVSILKSQTCIIDSLSMTKIGDKELVNGEFLFLYDCSNGHKMWLYPNETEEQVSNNNDIYYIEDLSLTVNIIETEENNEIDDTINNLNEYPIEVLLHNKIESEISDKKNESKLDMNLYKIMKDQNKLFKDKSVIEIVKPKYNFNSIKTGFFIISGLYLLKIIL